MDQLTPNFPSDFKTLMLSEFNFRIDMLKAKLLGISSLAKETKTQSHTTCKVVSGRRNSAPSRGSLKGIYFSDQKLLITYRKGQQYVDVKCFLSPLLSSEPKHGWQFRQPVGSFHHVTSPKAFLKLPAQRPVESTKEPDAADKISSTAWHLGPVLAS